MAEDRSTKADAPAWDALCKDGGGMPHGETDGTPPISNDAGQGGSMTPSPLGYTAGGVN